MVFKDSSMEMGIYTLGGGGGKVQVSHGMSLTHCLKAVIKTCLVPCAFSAFLAEGISVALCSPSGSRQPGC